MVKNTGRPGYLQIADDLRDRIRRGTLAPGQALPSTTQLATAYDASLSVVKLAVGVLRNEGLVIGQQGKGVFVREDAAPTPPASDELAEIRATLRDLSARLEKVEAKLSDE